MMETNISLLLSASDVFNELLRASWQGGIFVALVWVACRSLRLSSAVRCTLWWLAALKLIIVLLPVGSLPLPVLEARRQIAAVESGSAAAHTRVSPLPTEIPLPEPAVGDRPGPSHQNSDPLLTLTTLAVALWTIGAAASLGMLAYRLGKILRIARRSQPATPEILLMTERLTELLRLDRVPEIRLSGEIDTPLVICLPRAMILLPIDSFASLSPASQRMALCHELVHIRRWDPWLAHVPALAQRLLFFHPLVHFAVREYEITREAACDAAVIEELDAAPRDYGRLLLALGVSRVPTPISAPGTSRSYSNLKRRITMLCENPNPSKGLRKLRWLAVAVAAVALIPVQLVPQSTKADGQPKAVVAPVPQVAPAPQAAPAKARPAAAPAAPVVTPPVAAVAPAPLRITAQPTPASAAAPQAVRAERVRERDLTYVLFLNDQHRMMSGSDEDVQRAEKHRKGREQLLWFSRNGREYVVRDPAVLKQVQDIFEPLREIGSEQSQVGAKQSQVGSKQAEVGARQAEVGRKQAEIGARQAELGSRQAALARRQAGVSAREREDFEQEFHKEKRQLDAEMNHLSQKMHELGAEMESVSKPMQEFGKEMETLGKEMSVLGRKMEEAAGKAEKNMSELLDRAIANGKASEVK